MIAAGVVCVPYEWVGLGAVLCVCLGFLLAVLMAEG